MRTEKQLRNNSIEKSKSYIIFQAEKALAVFAKRRKEGKKEKALARDSFLFVSLIFCFPSQLF